MGFAVHPPHTLPSSCSEHTPTTAGAHLCTPQLNASWLLGAGTLQCAPVFTPLEPHGCACAFNNSPRGMCSARSAARALAPLPWYSSTFMEGQKRLNSPLQLRRVLRGPMMRKGPCTPRLRRWLRKEMVWTCREERGAWQGRESGKSYIKHSHILHKCCAASLQLPSNKY